MSSETVTVARLDRLLQSWGHSKFLLDFYAYEDQDAVADAESRRLGACMADLAALLPAPVSEEGTDAN